MPILLEEAVPAERHAVRVSAEAGEFARDLRPALQAHPTGEARGLNPELARLEITAIGLCWRSGRTGSTATATPVRGEANGKAAERPIRPSQAAGGGALLLMSRMPDLDWSTLGPLYSRTSDQLSDQAQQFFFLARYQPQ